MGQIDPPEKTTLIKPTLLRLNISKLLVLIIILSKFRYIFVIGKYIQVAYL